jgi:glycosyltransferase involved in cell wall biosynthesis
MNDYPMISILTPTYNRSKFLPLYVYNLVSQSYPHNKLEVCIYDDGEEPFCKVQELRELIYPMKLVYHYNRVKKTIGEKRNYLVKKLASSKICIMIDDDDIYLNDYIKNSYETLRDNKAGLVGSNGMIFTYPKDSFKMTGIKCKEIFQIHEATMCFSKKYFNSMGGFSKSSQGEGGKFILDRKNGIVETDIRDCMICVAHDGNTVDKNQFNTELNQTGFEYTGDRKSILKQILNVK